MPRQSIKSRKMMRSLLQNGKKYHSPNLTLYLDKSLPIPPEQYLASFIVSSTLIRRAVDRNRIRRWLREDIRQILEPNDFSGAMIVKFKGGDAKIAHPQLTEELRLLLRAAVKNAN